MPVGLSVGPPPASGSVLNCTIDAIEQPPLREHAEFYLSLVSWKIFCFNPHPDLAIIILDKIQHPVRGISGVTIDRSVDLFACMGDKNRALRCDRRRHPKGVFCQQRETLVRQSGRVHFFQADRAPVSLTS